MHCTSRILFAALLVAFTMPALADKSTRADRFEQRRALVTEFAGAPRRSVSYMRNYDFEPLGDHTLLLYESINRAYLVEIEDFCPELTSVMAIGIDNKTSTLSAKFDSIQVRGRSCRILEIRPVDVKAMKAAQKKRRELEKAEKSAGKSA